MPLILDLQIASKATDIPALAMLEQWMFATLKGRLDDAELVIRVVDAAESQQLNRDYRGKDSPTNVLSFPFEPPPEVSISLIGDLVICAPIVSQEAIEQGKPLRHHWAHMVVHGILHLLGYDHLQDQQADEMESLEKAILEAEGIPDPYL